MERQRRVESDSKELVIVAVDQVVYFVSLKWILRVVSVFLTEEPEDGYTLPYFSSVIKFKVRDLFTGHLFLVFSPLSHVESFVGELNACMVKEKSYWLGSSHSIEVVKCVVFFFFFNISWTIRWTILICLHARFLSFCNNWLIHGGFLILFLSIESFQSFCGFFF